MVKPLPTSKFLPIRPDNRRRPSRQQQSVRKSPVDSVDNANRRGEASSTQSTAQIRQDWHHRLVFQILFVKTKEKDYTCQREIFVLSLKLKRMKQLSALNIARLRTEESFGYLKQVETETANLPIGEETGTPSEISLLSATNPVLEAKVNDFTTAVDAFDDALKASATNPATATATATDDARDASWRGSNNYLTAMCAHPDAEIATYAAEAKSLFDKYGDPTKLAQTEESGVLHNLLQDLEALDSAKRTALAFDVWMNDLKTKEDAFLAAAAARTEADAARQVGIVKETRTAAEAAYRSLVDTVNALAMINGDTAYATFIDHVNAMIERQKAISKARATRAKKEDEKPGEL